MTQEVKHIDEINGILYQDIKHLLDKTTLENILFTTRLMFVDNEELIEFINKLNEYGYENIALDYVENIYDNNLVLDFSQIKFNENKLK